MSSTFDLNFRTDDLTRWGDGLGRRLHPVEADLNFWILLELFLSLEENPTQPAQIQDITVNAENEMFIVLNDIAATTFGPFQLPTATFTWRDNWTPNTDYAKFDLFNNSTGLFLVLHSHTSNSIFNSTDGDLAGPFYKLLIAYPVNFDIGFFFPGKPGTGIDTGGPIFSYHTRQSFFLTADLPNSGGGLTVAPADDLVFNITQNDTVIGSITFGLGSTTPTFSLDNDTQFAVGDTLNVIAPDLIDTDAMNLTFTFAATKGDIEGPSSS